jgi:glycosyltransferase involved in cell wall biosynthesis
VEVVFCVPYGGDDEYRSRNWKTVRQFLETHHPDIPIVVGENHDELFNIARARNDAAAQAGDWDVAIFVDSDTMVHPDDLMAAIDAAAIQNKMVIAGDGKIYMDERTSQQYIDTGLMFPAPTDWPNTRHQSGHYDPASYYRDPCSGYVVVPRQVWEATGGYVHNTDPTDSFEDLVFFALTEIFGGGMTRTPGMQLHLWHPVAQRFHGKNHRLYHQLFRIKHRANAKNSARQLLEAFGHRPPR